MNRRDQQKYRSRVRRRRAHDGPWYERRQLYLTRRLRDLQRLYWLVCKRCSRAGVPVGRPGSRSEAVQKAMLAVRGLRGQRLARAVRVIDIAALDVVVDDTRRKL